MCRQLDRQLGNQDQNIASRCDALNGRGLVLVVTQQRKPYQVGWMSRRSGKMVYPKVFGLPHQRIRAVNEILKWDAETEALEPRPETLLYGKLSALLESEP
jgi:hypothetical protein